MSTKNSPVGSTYRRGLVLGRPGDRASGIRDRLGGPEGVLVVVRRHVALDPGAEAYIGPRRLVPKGITFVGVQTVKV